MRPLLSAIILAITAGCTGHGELPYVSLEPPLETAAQPPVDPDRLRVGIAPVLSAVSTFEHYNPMVNWLAANLDRPTTFVQRGTYHEINELTRRGAVDLAFICAGPWLLNGDGLAVLAVPEINGTPHYSAVCLTQAEREFEGFAELAGASFGFTDTLSFTGRAYTLARLAQLGTTPEQHFGQILQVEGHDMLLRLLARGELQGGCVNSVVFEHYSVEEPELMAALRVFERSEPFGAPPVVVNEHIDPVLEAELLEALVSLHETEEGRAALEALDVDRFTAPPPGLYDYSRSFLAVLDQDGEP